MLGINPYEVRQFSFLGPVVATIEMAESLEDAAEAAADLVFFRHNVRRLVVPVAGNSRETAGVFVAFGAKEETGDASDVRFYLSRLEMNKIDPRSSKR